MLSMSSTRLARYRPRKTPRPIGMAIPMTTSPGLKTHWAAMLRLLPRQHRSLILQRRDAVRPATRFYLDQALRQASARPLDLNGDAVECAPSGSRREWLRIYRAEPDWRFAMELSPHAGISVYKNSKIFILLAFFLPQRETGSESRR
ncbi:MAG: hypothetical protein BGP06_04095 [Rhizobiales bacterium 65-9]|nr:MAG: hypothetical protein BGP06_04095 [Rhizobiales bacterium 65-9]